MSRFNPECKNCVSKCKTLTPTIKIKNEVFECPCLSCLVQMVCREFFSCPQYNAYINLMYDKDENSFNKACELLLRGDKLEDG